MAVIERWLASKTGFTAPYTHTHKEKELDTIVIKMHTGFFSDSTNTPIVGVKHYYIRPEDTRKQGQS